MKVPNTGQGNANPLVAISLRFQDGVGLRFEGPPIPQVEAFAVLGQLLLRVGWSSQAMEILPDEGAPDLLEALEVISRDRHISTWLEAHDPMALRQVRAAIAKVKSSGEAGQERR